MRARLLRLAAGSAKVLGLTAVFVASAAAAVALHADLPPARRSLAALAERALGDLFEGTIVLEKVESLRIGRAARVRVARVDVLDRDGHLAVTATGVDATLDLGALLTSVARGATDVAIEEASFDGAEVVLERDVEPGLRLAHAFRLRGGGSAAAGAGSSSRPPPRLRIRRARVGHAWVHGDVIAPMLDADARDVRGTVGLEGGVVAVGLERADVVLRAPSLPAQALPLTGVVNGELAVALATTQLTGKAELRGETGGLPLTATARLDGSKLDARLELPTAQPDALARAWPLLRLARPASLVVTARGAWPSIVIDGTAKLGDGTVKALLDVDVRGAVTATGVVTASELDLRAFGGPETRLAGTLSGSAALQDGRALGSFRLVTEEGTVAGERLPPVTADARFQDRTLAVSGRAEEPGLRAAFNAALDVPTQAVTFDVQARANDLRAVPRLRRAASGAVQARANGRIDLAAGTVGGVLSVTADGLADGVARVGHARATAFVSGPLRAPVADATASATDVRFAEAGKAALVYPEVTARARVRLPSFDLENVSVRATTEGRHREDAEIALRADRVRFAGGLVVDGARLEGPFGALDVAARTTPDGVTIRAKGEDVELGRAASATGLTALRRLPRGTRADVDVDLTLVRGRPDGHVDLRVRDGAALDAALDVVFTKGHARGTARVGLAPFGEVRARDIDLEVPTLDARALASATGSVELDGSFDLARGGALLASLLGPAAEDVSATSGLATFTARLERGTPGVDPAVRATVRTSGLSVTVTRAGREQTFAGVDLALHAAWDGATNDAEAALLLWDPQAALATVSAKASVPLGAWLRGAARPTREALAGLEVMLRADAPERAIASLPVWLLPRRVDGRFAATLSSSGPLARPRVAGALRATGLRDGARSRSDATYGPVDGSVELHWDGEDVVAVVAADERVTARDARATRTRATAAPRVPGSARGLVLGRLSARELVLRGSDPAWRGSAEMSFDRLDLTPLPLPYNARGNVSGRVSFRDVNGTPTFDATAHLGDLVLSNARIGSGEVAVGGRDGALFGVLQLTQAEGGRAQLQLVSRALVLRGREAAWNDQESTRLDYALQGVRLSIVRPIVRRLFPEIDGRVDGRGSVTLAAGTQTFEGGAAISDGRLYVNLLGEELTNLGAVLHFEPNGVFRVQDATARIGEGDVRASMTGRMNGLHFASANAAIVIPSKRGIPLSTEGATYAEATGRAGLQMVMSEDRSTLLCSVDVPSARFELPDRRTQQLQPTDDEPTIAIGKRGSDGRFTKVELHQRGARGAAGASGRSGNGTPAEERDLVTRFTVSVGRDVVIEGRGMRMVATGLVLASVGDELGVTGRIDLTEGTVDVQGRRFTLDRGTLTFLEGERPDNPTLLASAYWDAPDGTRVWAEFADPLTTGKLTLRSEPPYTYNEILSLLVFGRPEANIASAGGGGVAGSVVAPGLNRALEELSGGELDVKANVGSTRVAEQTRPEVTVRRGRLGVTVGYVVGPPSTIQPDRTLVTIDWQFLPRWSVAATGGDAYTTILDVLYRYRY